MAKHKPATRRLLASSHRFRDKVAVYAANPSDGGTLYLPADQAERFAESILAAVRSIRSESFVDSNAPVFTLEESL